MDQITVRQCRCVLGFHNIKYGGRESESLSISGPAGELGKNGGDSANGVFKVLIPVRNSL